MTPLTFRAAQRAHDIQQRLRQFANPHVVCEGWYVVATAHGIRVGDVRPVALGPRRLVVYRDHGGVVRAVDRACAHLGADLSKGTVVTGGLQCGFHQWCWGPDGSCTSGGGVAARRRLGTYAVRERWGLVWVWAGTTPAYELPDPELTNRAHVLRLPPQRLRCHGHVVLGNGLDLSHVVPVHRFQFVDDPLVEPMPPHQLRVHIHVRFFPTLMRRVLGLADRTARWQFTVIGPSLAWVRVLEPTPFELLWTAAPVGDGHCETRTLFFLPRRRALIRAVPMMVATTWADRGVLEDLDFRPGFVPADAVFARYAELIDALPAWPEAPA